jgi:hypothetical protein
MMMMMSSRLTVTQQPHISLEGAGKEKEIKK